MPKLSEAHHSKHEVKTNIDQMASTLQNMSKNEIPSDVMGSYTGTPKDGDKPVQDADDL